MTKRTETARLTIRSVAFVIIAVLIVAYCASKLSFSSSTQNIKAVPSDTEDLRTSAAPTNTSQETRHQVQLQKKDQKYYSIDIFFFFL
jgi:hypothetical protein